MRLTRVLLAAALGIPPTGLTGDFSSVLPPSIHPDLALVPCSAGGPSLTPERYTPGKAMCGMDGDIFLHYQISGQICHKSSHIFVLCP